MLYTLEVPGFEGQRLEIDAGAFKKTLLVNGVKAPSAGVGKYRLTRNDGREVTTKWTSSFGARGCAGPEPDHLATRRGRLRGDPAPTSRRVVAILRFRLGRVPRTPRNCVG
jgi:hypothetical protein